MMMFEDREDVEEWLEPLDYETFWREVSIFPIELQSKESCDEQIARGVVSEKTVLNVLKGFVRLQLIDLFQLKTRDCFPHFSMH